MILAENESITRAWNQGNRLKQDGKNILYNVATMLANREKKVHQTDTGRFLKMIAHLIKMKFVHSHEHESGQDGLAQSEFYGHEESSYREPLQRGHTHMKSQRMN